jgi:hypothetical protein
MLVWALQSMVKDINLTKVFSRTYLLICEQYNKGKQLKKIWKK